MNKKKYFFNIWDTFTWLKKKKNNINSSIIINDVKNEKFSEKIKNTLPFITEIKNKKTKDFEKAVKKF